jgi:hypothetical protein
MQEGLGALIKVAFDLAVDYQVLRLALIRREVEGQRIDGHWFVDRESARRWKRERERAKRARAKRARVKPERVKTDPAPAA